MERCFDLNASSRNSPKKEKEFRETCSSYESQCSTSNSPLSQNYQNYIDLYNQTTSLYLSSSYENRTILIIYDTENERRRSKMIDTPKPLNEHTCITQLPNGDLFCFGYGYPSTGTTLIIDKNYYVKVLRSGPPCSFSSGIYFEGNIYCFGGINNNIIIPLSCKFNLNESRWIGLTPMPIDDFNCHSVLFNGNILISGVFNRKLFLYSIEINSFSILPYEFGNNKRKVLINIEKLYLIECADDGLIYESEDEYNWKKISSSAIGSGLYYCQLYCLYNKSAVYIAAGINHDQYFKFDLNQKNMTRF